MGHVVMYQSWVNQKYVLVLPMVVAIDLSSRDSRLGIRDLQGSSGRTFSFSYVLVAEATVLSRFC